MPETVCSDPPEVSNYGQLLVLGTLKLDVITAISADSMAVEEDVYERTEVRFEVGGTAASVARAAALAVGWTAHILAAVGDDALTPAIDDFIKQANATSSLQRCDGTPNAGVVLVGVGNGETARRRLLLSSAHSPHLLLSPDHVHKHESRFDLADVFLADCYSLQAPLSTLALDTALELARSHNLYTILDLVPHDLPRTITLEVATPRIAQADLVVAEARTLIGMLRGTFSAAEVHDPTIAHDAVKKMLGRFPEKSWLVRYGLGHIERCLLANADGRLEYWTTYRHITEPRGFGDALLLHELSHIIPWRGAPPPLVVNMPGAN